MNKSILSLAVITVLVLSVFSASLARADGSLNKVNHIIIVMQENHSFDNYFGVLPYAKNGLFHPPPGSIHSTAPCNPNDHQCVDGLRCSRDTSGNYTCVNSNPESNGAQVFAFHDNNYCPAPDLDHGWPSSHREANFSFPNSTLASSPNDGFVRVNDATEQLDTSSGESTKDDDTMGFYNEADLPYYYALAQTFAIDDSYFCDVIGPTVPNRFYLAAATSFGHLTTSEVIPPSGGYKPITGTIFDLLDKAGVPWVDYFTDLSQAGDFRNPVPPNILPVAAFFVAAATGTLPPVTFVDPELLGSVPASAVNGGLPSPSNNLATDEHPPHDIRAGEFWVAQVVNAVRSGPNWKDSIIFINYDEHGGFYDHVMPAPAPQGGALTPDGIAPGQCADLSSPPASTQPGGGANCNVSKADALNLCPAFTPTGAYPTTCATFNQLGFRVPFVAVSPFSKPSYVSHTIGSHASLLAMIEKRFLNNKHLTARDANANTLEDMFNFDAAPSLNASVSPLLAPLPNLLTDGNGSCIISFTFNGVPVP